MGEATKIQWCHHTFNPWRGCAKVSPGCQNCYAETMSKRNPSVLGEWGPEGKRVVASLATWRQPLKWNRQAEKAGERRRVFCASMADVFEDRPELFEPRMRLWETIISTPNLDWLLLTKRPENFKELYPPSWTGKIAENIWLGVSVENQQCADERIPLLLRTPARVRFLSCEPLLSQVILHKYFAECECGHGHGFTACPNTGGVSRACHRHGECYCCGLRPKLHWCIVGGESGKKARVCHVEWIRSLVEQCRAAGVACFVKQTGSRVILPPGDAIRMCNSGASMDRRSDSKGGNPDDWPPDLRVRQFPEVSHV